MPQMEQDENAAQVLELARAADTVSQWAHAAVDRPEHRAKMREAVREYLPLAERMAGTQPPAATQEMIEAGWEALDCEGLSCPPVETMVALWRAMWAAR